MMTYIAWLGTLRERLVRNRNRNLPQEWHEVARIIRQISKDPSIVTTKLKAEQLTVL